MRSRKPGSEIPTLARLGSVARAIVAASASSRGGSISDLAQVTKVGEESVRQRLSALRGAGIARWVDVHTPAKTGRPFESRTYVKLRDPSPSALAQFGACCLSDRSIASAAMISGPFAYVLTTLDCEKITLR